MKNFQSLADILVFAISLEKMSHQFYLDLSQRTQTEAMKQVLLDFAREEVQHQERLEGIICLAETVSAQALDSAELSRYITAAPVPENMTYEEAVKLAMNKEHAAMMLYQILARLTEDKKMRDVLELLAMEEARHKSRFEKEYNTIRLRNN